MVNLYVFLTLVFSHHLLFSAILGEFAVILVLGYYYACECIPVLTVLSVCPGP